MVDLLDMFFYGLLALVDLLEGKYCYLLPVGSEAVCFVLVDAGPIRVVYICGL